MNKQELINELAKYIERLENVRSDYEHGRRDAYRVALESAKKLDEPQKPVVPKFVAEYLNYCMANEWTLGEALTTGKFQFPEYLYKAVDWLNDSMNQNIFAQAWLFGYEVKKEPMYYVILSENKGGWKYTFLDEEGSTDYTNNKAHIPTFTEKEIKGNDERFWPFAVPVEEVIEG